LLALTSLPTTVDNRAAAPTAAASAARPAIVVDHVFKTFRLPHRNYSTLKELALHPFSARTFDELKAVRDVSVNIREGEFFGIVGRNGSGKSTLLKCLAGIYDADAGSVTIQGRLAPFIELGVGFNPELTARDNVILNAIMLGLTRRQAKARFDEIIAFAELEEFVDLPLKNYSSGMSVRLAFAVTVQVDADVLLIDEVLAVGDAAFQLKCFDQFHRLKDSGKTIVFVTHDMSSIKRFCDRAMLLERGRVLSIDGPDEISRAYNELNFGRVMAPSAGTTAPVGRHVAEVRDAWFELASGERVSSVPHGVPMTMSAQVTFHERTEDPWFAFHLRNDARHVVFTTGSFMHTGGTGTFEAGESAVVRVTLDNWFAPGSYDLTPTVARTGGAEVLDVREDLASMLVHGIPNLGGVIEPPHTFELRRG
jgi:ABC-type polysaccharide/polyol phosphate transport system ATPase subunit